VASIPTTNELLGNRHTQDILADLREGDDLVAFWMRPAPRHRSTEGQGPSLPPLNSRSVDVAPRIRSRRTSRWNPDDVLLAIAVAAIVLVTVALCIYLRLTFSPGGQP
jgi:hypothetical protein